MAEPTEMDSKEERPRPRAWRRTVWLAIAVVIVAVAAGFAERGVRDWVSRTVTPTGEAEWIWASGRRTETRPRAFFAVRDFELVDPPASARLLVQVDEEYVLFLNGRRVGSNRYYEGAPLDQYEVGEILLPGLNRLAMEVRSARGAGGLLVCLEDPAAGTRLVSSDGEWRLFARHNPGIVRGWLGLEQGVAPAVWGRVPTGRWRRPAVGPLRPTFETLMGSRLERSIAEPVESFATRPASGPKRQAALDTSLDVSWDWGREVTGYLVLEIEPSAQPRFGLLQTGDGAKGRIPEARGTAVVTVAGSSWWRAPVPRRLSSVRVLGLEGVRGAWIYEVAADPPGDAIVDLLPPREGERGVFGLAAPALRTPVEHEVGRKLQRVAGVAGREKL